MIIKNFYYLLPDLVPYQTTLGLGPNKGTPKIFEILYSKFVELKQVIQQLSEFLNNNNDLIIIYYLIKEWILFKSLGLINNLKEREIEELSYVESRIKRSLFKY